MKDTGYTLHIPIDNNTTTTYFDWDVFKKGAYNVYISYSTDKIDNLSDLSASEVLMSDIFITCSNIKITNLNNTYPSQILASCRKSVLSTLAPVFGITSNILEDATPIYINNLPSVKNFTIYHATMETNCTQVYDDATNFPKGMLNMYFVPVN